MLNDISKKIALKKTFFITQLDTLLNTVQNEYQEIIHKQEMELSLLRDKNEKYKKDIQNLVEIRNNLAKENTKLKAENSRLKILLSKKDSKEITDKVLLEENEKLVKKIEALERELKKLSQENKSLNQMKEKILSLQAAVQKGSNAYNQNLAQQKNEDLIKEIKEALSKEIG